MRMDALTPEGRRKDCEQDAVWLFLEHNQNHQYFPTPKTTYAAVDGLLAQNGILCGVVEVKSRHITLEEFQTRYRNEWLLSHSKLLRGAEAGKILGVPFIGFLYLVPSETLIVKTLANDYGAIIADYYVDETVTQATVNGGLAARQNAFIPMDGADIYFWM